MNLRDHTNFKIIHPDTINKQNKTKSSAIQCEHIQTHDNSTQNILKPIEVGTTTEPENEPPNIEIKPKILTEKEQQNLSTFLANSEKLILTEFSRPFPHQISKSIIAKNNTFSQSTPFECIKHSQTDLKNSDYEISSVVTTHDGFKLFIG